MVANSLLPFPRAADIDRRDTVQRRPACDRTPALRNVERVM
jgi:hypothetical protein